MEKMILHLNVLSLDVQDGDFRQLDTVEVVAIDRRRIKHLHLQILQ